MLFFDDSLMSFEAVFIISWCHFEEFGQGRGSQGPSEDGLWRVMAGFWRAWEGAKPGTIKIDGLWRVMLGFWRAWEGSWKVFGGVVGFKIIVLLE